MASFLSMNDKSQFFLNFCQHFENLLNTIQEREFSLCFYYPEDGDLIAHLLQHMQICWFTNKERIERSWQSVDASSIHNRSHFSETTHIIFMAEEEIKEKILRLCTLSEEDFEKEWLNIVDLLVVFLGKLELDSSFATEFQQNWVRHRREIVRLWKRQQSVEEPCDWGRPLMSPATRHEHMDSTEVLSHPTHRPQPHTRSEVMEEPFPNEPNHSKRHRPSQEPRATRRDDVSSWEMFDPGESPRSTQSSAPRRNYEHHGEIGSQDRYHSNTNRPMQIPSTTTRNAVTDMETSSPKPGINHRRRNPSHGSKTTNTTTRVTYHHGVPNMEMPLPLLTANADRKWEICQEAANVLNGITAEMAVVAIVGKYRTGKSYLMNRLAGGNSGFGLGATIQSETKGIWMWAKPHPQDPSKCLLLLDTEGLYDVEKGDQTNDMQLFTFAVLLSNCLVHNALGNIANDFVLELQLVSELTENIKVKEASRKDDVDTEFASYFPVLFVVLRDFFLELKLGGKDITSDEYLENSLKLKPGSSTRMQQYNAPRQCITKYFPKRKCFVLPKPVQDDTRLKDLDMRPDTDLVPDFLAKCQLTVESILHHTKSMCIDGNLIYGPGFLHLVAEYVRAINEGGVPCIESALDVMVEKECRKAYETSLAHYNKEMEQRVGIHMPVALDILHTKHEACQNEAVDVYRQTSIFDEKLNKYAAKLEEDICVAFQDFMRRNEECSRHLCQQALEMCFADLDQAINDGVFAMPGGHDDFAQMQQRCVDEYNRCENLGPQKQAMLHEYLMSKETAEQAIINADNALTQKAKEEAALQRSLRDQEEHRRRVEEQNEQMRRENERQQRDHEYMVEQMKDEFEAKNERLRREQDEKLERQKRQYERLMNEGLEQQAAQHRRAMDQIISDRREQERREQENRRQLAEYQRQMANIAQDQHRMQEQQARERAKMKREMERARTKGEAERRRIEERRLENERRYQREQEDLRRQCEQTRAAAERKKKSNCVVM